MPLGFKRGLKQSWWRHVLWLPVPVSLLLVAVPALAACTDEIDQSAVQPGQVIIGLTPTAEAGFASPGAFGTPSASPSAGTGTLSPSSDSGGLPAPSHIYFTNRGDLWQIPLTGGAAAPVVSGKSLLAFAPSPDGDQVAVVYVTPDSGQEHLSDVKSDGTSVIDVGISEPSDDSGSRGGDIQSIAWAPQGDRVVVARQDGSIAVVTSDGRMSQIVPADPNRFPGALSVSPDGKMLLFLDPALPGRATSLYTVPMIGGEVRKLVDGTQSSYPVLEARWIPNGDRIGYVQVTAASPSGTGDVFVIDAGTAESQLAVAATQFAPVAGIGTMTFSPDGEWIAFTLYGPNASDVKFQGLWLTNLATNVTQQIEVGAGQAVTDLWWGKDSLLFRAMKANPSDRPTRYNGMEPFSLYSVATGSEEPIQRYTSP